MAPIVIKSAEIIIRPLELLIALNINAIHDHTEIQSPSQNNLIIQADASSGVFANTTTATAPLESMAVVKKLNLLAFMFLLGAE